MKIEISDYKKDSSRDVQIELIPADTYSLNSTLAEIIVPSLIRFKEDNKGFPYALTAALWDEIIDKMIWSFEQLRSGDYFEYSHEEDYRNRLQEGLNLFAEWYLDLWW